MELTGDILIDALPEQVWLALNDPKVLLHSIPGCEEIQAVSPTETHVRLLSKMGPVRARFVGKILMSEVRPGEGCVLNFDGSAGTAGFAKGTSTVSLVMEGSRTRLRYTAAASVGGKLGQIGGRMIEASAKQMADQFFLAFSQQLGASVVTPAGQAAAAAAPPGATASVLAAPAAEPPLPQATVFRPVPPPAAPSEGVRVLWFALGAAATAFGFWVASALMH